MGTVERYLLQLKNEKRQWRQAAMILSILSLFVVVGVSWNLRMTGITIANGATCGLEEHQHAEECYLDTEVCAYEEHIHDLSCYPDETADVETADTWEASLPDLTGLWTDDLVFVAQSQLGCSESEKNYVVAEDGVSRNGITRYGQWYGNPYGEWSSMFMMFCLNYAGVPEDIVPWSPGVHNMMLLAEEQELSKTPDSDVGNVANLLFLNTDEDEHADHVFLVIENQDGEITAIGGDWENTVAEIKLTEEDSRIMGYIDIQELQSIWLPENEDEPVSGSVYRLNKDDDTYTIDVYALPVDGNGNSIAGMNAKQLQSFDVKYNNNITVENKFDTSLGTYHSAYLGTATSVDVDNIKTLKCTRSGYWWNYQYHFGYELTSGDGLNNWRSNADASISLYIRYIPNFTVKYESDGFSSLTETVEYNKCPTLTEPGEWARKGYTAVGWIVNGDEQNVYTFEELMQLPVTENVTYTAKWHEDLTLQFDLGEYKDDLYEISPEVIAYGKSLSTLPTPAWKNNVVTMAFDGWYADAGFTQKVTGDYKFFADTTLYAKWLPKEEGYYIYFMDFTREGQSPLVLVTYSVTEGQTISPYTLGNVPNGKVWDGKWYLEYTCQNAYNFAIPVSQMTEYLTGANGRDLYIYPGTRDVCRAIFVTYGTKVDPITAAPGEIIDLGKYVPERSGYEFKGWMLKDGTNVSGKYTLNETTTFYAKWEAGYVPFEAIMRIENANDTDMTQAEILGTWYAKAGSQILVKSTYSGTGNNRKGTHEVVCVIAGTEYPVYKNAGLTQKATLDDVYSKYFVYNNTGTKWTDEVNWDDVYTSGEVPYSTRPISSAGDTIINFDYMRVRKDIVFTIPNTNTGGYIDIYKLQQNGLITGSVTYTGTKPTATGQNVSATGVSAQNISWSYTASSTIGAGKNNYYTLHNMKYGQRIFEVYPVGGSWLTARSAAYHQYAVGSGQYFSSRRQDLTADFFSGSGRGLTPYSLTVEFRNQEYIALMYAVECLADETPDFIHDGIGYKVDTELCEVVKHTGFFSIKDLDGCEAGQNMLGKITSGSNKNSNKYYTAKYTTDNSDRVALKNAKIDDGTSVYTLFTETYWPYYEKFNGVEDITTFAKIYIFYYDRLHMDIQFNLGYDSNGDGSNDIVTYEEIAYGEKIDEYQFGMPDYEQHPKLNREGYEFAGWLDSNGFVLEADDWASLIAKGDSENNTMIFIAKWEKISNNIVEYYEDRSSAEPFESHYFDDGELVQYPTMLAYPQGWVWQEYGEGLFQRFDWDVPMYGEYGVQETREINGEEVVVNVIRIYGTWDETQTKVIYDPNAPQGGIPGTEPVDSHEYTIWQSSVPVASRGDTANADPDMIFVGWKLDRNGVVYHPGDHVPVRWPRTMVFTAQWAKVEDVVYLRYDPNGGTPESRYPNDSGFHYKRNATAAVWDNKAVDDTEHFTRTGYEFVGWNTMPDGSGTAYAPDSTIVLTERITTLYAQWEKNLHTLSLYKIDYEDQSPLEGANFGLYKKENDMFLTVAKSLTTGTDGYTTFDELESDTIYKLVEEKAPDGYAILEKEIFFKLHPEGKTVSLVFCDAEGNIIPAPKGVTGEYITGNQFLTLTVENLRGYELPGTGGRGMYPYILCGLLIALMPLVYELSLRRKQERRPEA